MTDEMSETMELLPCPFCGEQGELDGTTWRPTDGKEVGWITCKGCNAYGPTLPKQAAIAAWNTRTPTTPAQPAGDDLVRRLRLLGDRSSYEPHMHHAAADRIKALTAERERHLSTLDHMGAAVERMQKAEADLAAAVEALEEAVYLLDPDEEDIAKETGLFRIVSTLARIKEKRT